MTTDLKTMRHAEESVIEYCVTSLTCRVRIAACVFWHHHVSLDPVCTSWPIPGHVSWECTLESSVPLLSYEQEIHEKCCKMEKMFKVYIV